MTHQRGSGILQIQLIKQVPRFKELLSHPKSGASWEGYVIEETIKATNPDEANEACSYAKDISFDEFLKDGKTARAIIRPVEILGEAASKISDELRQEHRSAFNQQDIAQAGLRTLRTGAL